jgi:hypothetical protein
MRYRKLNSDDDMQYGNQQADYWRDVPDAVAQAVATRLRLFTGEWFLDIEEGTPWQGWVLGKHTLNDAELVIRQRILETQGVLEILSFDSSENRDERSVIISATIGTIYGVAEINEVL